MQARLTAIAASCLALGMGLASARGADFHERRRIPGLVPQDGILEPTEPPLPRYFPREGSDGPITAVPSPRRLARGCRPRRVPVPTNAPDDPSYVGSTYGLGKPSYYGFVPGFGVDDPFGRPVLPYCP